jgi:peptide/nickel transport system substrate-binding protein
VNRTSFAASIAGIVVLTLTAACSTSEPKHDSKGNRTSSAPSATPALIQGGFAEKGGTVEILSNKDFEHLDPCNNYVTDSNEIGRLINRTLTVIDDAPGQKPVIKPDLAAGLGTASDGGRTWTFTLRSGLKYEDGTPITAQDVKYAVERTFDPALCVDGPTYLKDWLLNSNGYTGPYSDPKKDLTSVVTPNPSTIVFHFAGPHPDTNWMMSLLHTAPVPKAKDDRASYDFHPVSSGPYRIQSYTRDRSMTLVRNPNWDAASDPNRPALPDRFHVTFGIATATRSQRLLADESADKNAITLSAVLQNADLPKLRQPGVKSRYVNGSAGGVQYLAFNEQKITDPDVRKALALAINRQALQTEYGGSLFGEVASSFIPEGIEGRAPADLGLKPTGDPAAAKAALHGKSVPTLHYGVPSTSVTEKTVAVQVQSDLKAIGVNVVIDSIPSDAYYKTLTSTNAPDIMRGGWTPDWPTMTAVVPPVLGPDARGETWGSTNLCRYFDATVSKQIASISESDQPPAQIAKQLNDISNQVLSTNWPMLPTIAELNPRVVGSNIRNAGISTVFGQLELLRIGVEH